jgi:hypothetical protein
MERGFWKLRCAKREIRWTGGMEKSGKRESGRRWFLIEEASQVTGPSDNAFHGPTVVCAKEKVHVTFLNFYESSFFLPKL